MRDRIRRTAAAVAAAGALAAGMVMAGGAAGAAAATGATGAAAAKVPGIKAVLPANAASNPKVTLSSVSCPSAGNCTAVGYYLDDTGSSQGLLLTETSGSWATGTEAPLPADAASDPDDALTSVSCSSAGNCTAVGYYLDNTGSSQGLLLTETSGTWAAGAAPTLPANAGSNPDVFLPSVSCSSAGNCTAVGDYHDSSFDSYGLLLTQTAGTWAAGVEAGLPADAGSNSGGIPEWVSCASAGNCTAVGSYTDSSGSTQGLLLTETAGTWAAGVEAALPAGAGSNPEVDLTSVSCGSAGNCTAVGYYLDSSGNWQGILLTQTAGGWAAGIQPAPPAGAATNPDAVVTSVSCPSAGNCTVVGSYTDSSGSTQGLLLTETAGTWAAGVEAAPPAGAESGAFPGVVSCVSADNCTAVGTYTDNTGSTQVMLLTQTAGTWATGVEASLPAGADADSRVSLTSVSCGAPANCAAVGNYRDTSGNTQGLLITQVPTPDLSLTDTASATASTGRPYRYTLKATNTGGSPAASVRVTDAVPATAYATTATTTKGSCTLPHPGTKTTGGTVHCTVGRLHAGARVTVTITVTPTQIGTVHDKARVTASNVTADSDDAATASTTVQGP